MADSILETLGALRQGGTAAELDEALSTLVGAVRATAKAGTLTLKLTIKPASKGDVATLVLEDAITVKPPALERGGTIFYAVKGDKLSRRDPRQPELGGLGLREVAQIRDNIRDVEERA